MAFQLCVPISGTVTQSGTTGTTTSFVLQPNSGTMSNFYLGVSSNGARSIIHVNNINGRASLGVGSTEGGSGLYFDALATNFGGLQNTVNKAITPNGTDNYYFYLYTGIPIYFSITWGGLVGSQPALQPPTITSISPTSGSTSGGTIITITGTNFTGATGVTIGGTATIFTVINSTTITATTSAGIVGTASVLVTTPGGTNAANTLFRYVATPVVNSISPSSGTTYGGTLVTINGANFTGVNSVTFRGVAANFTVVNSTTITATAPAGVAGTASILVTNAGLSNAANTLFTYVIPEPFVTSVFPFTGTIAGGTRITITGTGFTGATSVTVGGVAATNIIVVSATSITATTPANTGTGLSVLVTTPGGTNIANTLFSYSSVDGFNPCNAPPNTNSLPFAFPTAPSLYQVYSFSGRAWVWVNYAWKRYCQ